MTKYTSFLLLLIFIFSSLFFLSVPQIVYGHAGEGSHEHPHPPLQNCMTCGKPDVPGQHFCEEAEREKQETQVQISNERANRKRLEEKYNDDKDKSAGDLVVEIWVSGYETGEQAVIKVLEWVTNKEGSVECQGCDDWVSEELEHWGTGNCAIGHEYWTCRRGENEAHAGCYWVDEPETNPDSMYEGAKYSITCSQCSNTSYTNNESEYEAWQEGFCCDGY